VLAPLLIATASVVAVVAALWVAVVDDPEGGRAVASAVIADAPEATGSLGAGVASPPAEGTAPGAGDSGEQIAALPIIPSSVGADPSLIEQSSYGPLPRVSPDGRRPREVYARRSANVPAGVPRIVIVIGGLGLSQTVTQSAIDALPEDVTLAFAPYGSSLQRWVGKAREGHHEVLLQIPMEPGGYEEQNPGAHTLLASGGASNRDDLHWVLSRMTGYAGVMNYLGGRFTADDTALLPILGEIGERGLFYLDDGSSPRSRTEEVGKALNVPVLTADSTLDRERTQAGIENELNALEDLARRRGLAVGVATAFPISVQTIAQWVSQAESRGVVVVPASAAVE